SKSLPRPVVVWLRHVPVAVLSAMLFPALLVRGDQADLSSSNLFLWAAIPTLLVAWKTRSLFSSVIVGMVVVAAARLAFGL
ncbi:MAG: AzlD domain-containing protein, partial [Chloroflexota bacterium]|nr:AzlD domain-containing protein [Chloroflexota bacterium]